MTTAAGPAIDALTLLCRRIRDLPRLDGAIVDDDDRRPLRIRIDVRRTGLTGYGVAERLRGLHGVRLEPRGGHITAVFPSGRSVPDQGTLLLFALSTL
jgi:hypothetical protein